MISFGKPYFATFFIALIAGIGWGPAVHGQVSSLPTIDGRSRGPDAASMHLVNASAEDALMLAAVGYGFNIVWGTSSSAPRSFSLRRMKRQGAVEAIVKLYGSTTKAHWDNGHRSLVLAKGGSPRWNPPKRFKKTPVDLVSKNASVDETLSFLLSEAHASLLTSSRKTTKGRASCLIRRLPAGDGLAALFQLRGERVIVSGRNILVGYPWISSPGSRKAKVGPRNRMTLVTFGASLELLAKLLSRRFPKWSFSTDAKGVTPGYGVLRGTVKDIVHAVSLASDTTVEKRGQTVHWKVRPDGTRVTPPAKKPRLLTALLYPSLPRSGGLRWSKMAPTIVAILRDGTTLRQGERYKGCTVTEISNRRVGHQWEVTLECKTGKYRIADEMVRVMKPEPSPFTMAKRFRPALQDVILKGTFRSAKRQAALVMANTRAIVLSTVPRDSTQNGLTLVKVGEGFVVLEQDKQTRKVMLGTP